VRSDTPSQIQVDAFEVQLGAALLIQMRNGDRTIRILADAGIVIAKGYPINHVDTKLLPAMRAFDPSSTRIDLIIGTHYDRDHLDGLVPVIDDPRIEIGEAWMPPVLNDDVPDAGYPPLHDSLFLGRQLERSEGQALEPYLRHKARVCAHYALAIRAAQGEDLEYVVAPEGDQSEPDTDLETFERYLEAAEGPRIGSDFPIEPPAEAAFRVLGYGRARRNRTRRILPRRAIQAARVGLVPFGSNPSAVASLQILQAGTAKDAISAISLAKVIQALGRRRVPIMYRTIDDGTPLTLGWDGARFTTPGAASAPSLSILGPSNGLVLKHADRIPTSHYEFAAHLISIPVRSITPSNQLSYVVRLDVQGQRLLIAGDAGMVDFRISRARWHQALIKALKNINIVQVAHHAGNNAYFYHALDAAGGSSHEFLLLSHATHDKTRPSPAFAEFMRSRAVNRRTPSVLFTSTPDTDKVKAFEAAIYPVVGTPNVVGDIRLTFDGGWQVDSHAIHV
jgi:hypothetical protein